MQDVFDAERSALRQRQRECRVHLREPHIHFFHPAPQQNRVFPKCDVGLVSEPVDPRHAIDRAALDEFDAVALRPFQALAEVPIRAVERVRVKADSHKPDATDAIATQCRQARSISGTGV